MGLNAATFLKRLEEVVSGHGFKQVIPNVGIHNVRTAAGALLDNGTTPTLAALETNIEGISIAAAATAIGELNFVLPEDYDEEKNYLRVRILAVSGGTTDTPSIDGTMYAKRNGLALTSDLNPTIAAVCPISTSYASWLELNCDGKTINDADGCAQPLRGGDVVQITLATGGTRGTTDTLNIYAIEIVYKGDLVYFDPDDR